MQITLRPWQQQDAEALARIADNRKIWLNLRNRFPHPYTLQDAEEWISLCLQEQPPVNFCIGVDGHVAGSAGIMLKDDVYKLTAEIGYFLGEDWWGKGIGTAAVRLLVDHAFAHFPLVKLYAEVFAHNKASMRVLEKNGFSLESVRKKAVLKNGYIIDDQVWALLKEGI